VAQASACAWSFYILWNRSPDLFFRAGQTIVFCGLSPTAGGRRNSMKKRTNCSVVVGVSVGFSTLPAPLQRRQHRLQPVRAPKARVVR
jgi:hypothetical protein